MKWYEANTIDELKSIGKLTDVKREINKDIKKVTGLKDLTGFIKMGSNSWKGQYNKIQNLKKIFNEFYGAEEGSQEKFFKNEGCKYIFYLLELQGSSRMEKLKIYKAHYINKDLAKEWYKEIAKKIHPDVCKVDGAEEAMAELTSIYNKMVNNE